MAASGVDPRELRVSDAERSHVMSLLEKATGRGLISLVEFDERSATVVAAKTRGDLNEVLLDLPGLVVAGPSAVHPPPGSTPAGLPGSAPRALPPALELTGWGNRDLRGYWVAPARIVIAGYAGATRLDFSNAQLTSRSVRIEFAGNRYGSLELIVPPGTSVRMDELETRGGSVENRVSPGTGTGALEVVLAGQKRGGRILIRHPRRKLFGGWA